MNKQEFCKKYMLTEDQFYGKEEIKGNLYLISLTSIPEGFNPTVGGDLYLSSLTSIPEGFNPTVGGDLDLISLTSIPEGFNPTVGGYLYLRSDSKYIGADVKLDFISWQNGKYILVDGEFTEVVSKKGNVCKVKYINNPKEFYLVSDGNGKYAHGETLEEAKADLIYKIDNRKKDDFKNLNHESVLKFEDAIVCYRVITGACSFGVKEYIKSRLPQPSKHEYSISEMIKLTENEYGGNSFKLFFNK